VGIKSSLLNGDLSLSADVYYMDIENYQAAVRVVDEFTTQTNIANNQANPVAYVTAQGNIDSVSVRGVELDAFYSGIPDVTLRFSGAYTDARYERFTNAAFPDEQAFLSTPERPFTDQSGLNLPGISKWTFNLGAEYTRPVLGDKLFRTSFNTSFNSRFNNTDTLSSFGVYDAYSRTDASIGLRFSNSFELGVVGRNVFDDRTHEEGFASFAPYPYPRWFGITVSGKLY
jgi:iron complex outermembrane recepter protein